MCKITYILSSGSLRRRFQRFPLFEPIRNNGSHIECRARSLDTISEEDHPRI
jgi:hypothetical protein